MADTVRVSRRLVLGESFVLGWQVSQWGKPQFRWLGGREIDNPLCLWRDLVHEPSMARYLNGAHLQRRTGYLA